MDNLQEKFNRLKEYLKSLGSVAVAFSGGVDSTFLLKAAHDVLGNRVIAVTARSCTFPKRELDETVRFCAKEKIRHIIVDSNELEMEGFRKNPVNRCYLCKKNLFSKIIKIAAENGIKNIAEGSNTDDVGDYRPGMTAVRELNVKSPLMEAGLSKEDIRALSKDIGLPTWNKPSFACLSSRFVYGETISREKLAMVDRAEQLLIDLKFSQVRVRIHNNLARIEVSPEEFERLLKNRERIVSEFKKYGFLYVTMDLTGYRTGSMNETLSLLGEKE